MDLRKISLNNVFHDFALEEISPCFPDIIIAFKTFLLPQQRELF